MTPTATTDREGRRWILRRIAAARVDPGSHHSRRPPSTRSWTPPRAASPATVRRTSVQDVAQELGSTAPRCTASGQHRAAGDAAGRPGLAPAAQRATRPGHLPIGPRSVVDLVGHPGRELGRTRAGQDAGRRADLIARSWRGRAGPVGADHGGVRTAGQPGPSAPATCPAGPHRAGPVAGADHRLADLDRATRRAGGLPPELLIPALAPPRPTPAPRGRAGDRASRRWTAP